MAEMTQEDYSSQVIDTSFFEEQDNDVVALSNFSEITVSHDNLLQMEREMVKTLKDELPLKLKEYTSKYTEVVSHLQEEVVLWKFKFNQKVKAFDELKLSFEKQSKEKEDLQKRLLILQMQKNKIEKDAKKAFLQLEEERHNNDGRISLSNDQGICCRSMITPFKSSTNSDAETSANLENTPDSTVTPHFSATNNSDKSNDAIVRNMEKMSKQKDDLPKPMAVVKVTKINVDGKNSELKSVTGGNFIDAYTKKKSPPEPTVENIILVCPPLMGTEVPSDQDLTWKDKEETIGEEIKVESEIENESGLLVERKGRKYDRDFLLQCRYMQVCMEKPANLPDIDVILDVPQPPQSRTGSSGGGWQRYGVLPSDLPLKTQKQYGQMVRPGFIQNTPQRYPLPVSTASLQQKNISQTQPPFWITTGKGGKSQPIDQNKLRNMAKRANNEQISLGPSSRFGQWARGSSAGLNNSSQEQEQSQGNTYSALQFSSGDPSSGRVLYDPRRSNSTGARTSSAGPRGSDKSRQKSGRESAIEAARALSNTSSEKSHYTIQLSQPSASHEKQHEVKENENKNETVNESLSEEELAKKTIALIDEYANIKDIKEAVACFTDLNSPSLHYFFVSTSVEYTYEKSMKVRGDTGRLLAELLSLNKLSKEQLLKGFNNIFEAADENSMDYPKLWNYLAEIINPLLGDRLKLNDLKPLILQHLAPIGKAAVLFAEILVEFKKSTCESEVVKLWNELQIDWSNILPPRLTIDEFLSRKNLNFLSSEANDELLKLLCASQLRNDIVFAHIEKNFKEEKRKEAEFINYLVSSVAESCLIKKEKETGPDCCEAKLKARRDILKKYLDNNMKLQLEALFTLQKIYAKYDKPKDMLSKFFNTLYDEEVITEGAFLNWKQDEDHSRQEAKGLALQATSSFFEWLQSAAVEGGEN